MKKHFWFATIILATLLLAACAAPTPPPETPTIVPSPTPEVVTEPTIVVSEVMAGAEGNNGYEFIELYNTSATEPIDLKGWTLWYQLAEGEDELILHRWTESAVVPPHGHFLLGRGEEDYGVTVDAIFEIALATSRGGLLLRKADDTLSDSLAWGDDAQQYGESDPAPAMERGQSLERKPGGEAGNGVDSADNGQDFALNSAPNPQGTASLSSPIEEERLEIALDAPSQINPGDTFGYALTIANKTEQNLHGIEAELLLPDEIEILSASDVFQVDGKTLTWHREELAPQETVSVQITAQAPWTYVSTRIANYYVQADDWDVPAYGGPVDTVIAGGSIPIETARTLLAKEVAVEGIATMYTGGYYAGGGNTKFYLADETGGIQVWVPGGEGAVEVSLGDRVRVQGTPELYRGAVELIVNDVDKVEIIEEAAEDTLWEPEQVSILDAATEKETLPAHLVQVEGEVLRAEEFSYSYEIDLADEEGNILNLYLDKNTGINIEMVELEDHYTVRGILEVRDGRLQLYPRQQADLQKVYPPVLHLTLDAPNTVAFDEVFTVTLTATNYTPDTMTGVDVSVALPQNVWVEEVLDEGTLMPNNRFRWWVHELEGEGGSVSVSVDLRAGTRVGYLTLENAWAVSRQWTDAALADTHHVFVGENVPIWAIQGTGDRSPYVLDPVTTSGVVTGAFPELDGFWIQELESDDDFRTSSGLFIDTEDASGNFDLEQGDWVEVSGVVRETYQQTQLKIDSASDVVVTGEGQPLPLLHELDPPQGTLASAEYYESLEGMYVRVTRPAMVVSPTTKYGEYTLVLEEHNVSLLFQGEENGYAITVDDGSSETHEDSSTLDYVVGMGDRVTDLAGPLAYTYGRYKILPIKIPQVVAVPHELPTLQPTPPTAFSIASWNVENLFDIKEPHPSSPPLPSLSEYQLDITKVVNTILASGAPTLIGFQEVENIDILEDIAAQEVLADYAYEAVLVEGTDSRGIDVGYLVRGDLATIRNVEQFPAPEGLTSRPPLLLEVDVNTGAGPLPIFVLNNHFTSMSGGEEATEPRRTAQAAWNVTILEELLAENPGAYVAVIGDLNSYYDSKPIDTLREAGLEHTFTLLPDEERYTYIYQGQAQVLDHILVTPELMALLSQVNVLHVNTNFPPHPAGDTSPMSKSDHDPVVVVFSLE
ncbi:MAG: Endonuclease YhcR [Chloroflexi bacterium]|nr:Endonuclease YhcR [Chloroflexota bacterium]